MTAPRKTQGPRVVKFIEANCVHPDGPLVGKPLLLHPWWKQVLYELFEVIYDEREQRWRRRYSEAYISVAKKNAKSTVLAAVGLYFLLADVDPDTGEPDTSALVVSAAASEEQGSNLLYGAARIMCDMSPTLKQLTLPMEKEIQVPSLARARMRNVASKAGTQDGANIKALLCDELHEWKGQRGRDLWHVLSGGTGARPNAMRIAITTAGHDQDSICYEKYEYGKKVAAGEIDDPGFYSKVAEAPEDADFRDPAVWGLANPLLGVSVLPSYIEDRVRRDPESVVRRYNCNQWVAAEDIWIPFGVWDACKDETLSLDPKLPLFVAIDIARNIDSSAVALVQRRETADGVRYVSRGHIWSNPYRPEDPRYADWRMNNNLVKELLRELFARFPVPAAVIDDEIKPGPLFAYDPWRFRPEAEALTGEGLAMVEFPQTDTRMIPASQALRETIVNAEIAHDGDKTQKQHIHNVVADQKERGWRISKVKGSGKKIDFAVALAIAVYHAQTQAPTPAQSVYDDPDKDLLILG
jgi:phage terminase large subunit-like protein